MSNATKPKPELSPAIVTEISVMGATPDEFNQTLANASSEYGRLHKRSVELGLIANQGKRTRAGEQLGRSDLSALHKVEPFSDKQKALRDIAVSAYQMREALVKLAKLA